jgi:hypothetical protein
LRIVASRGYVSWLSASSRHASTPSLRRAAREQGSLGSHLHSNTADVAGGETHMDAGLLLLH